MEYRNKKTGFTFFSECKISGGDWEPVAAKGKQENMESEPNPKEPDAAVPNQTDVGDDSPASGSGSDMDSVTVKEIKQELDAMGIKYSATAKKQELYDLMMSQGK